MALSHLSRRVALQSVILQGVILQSATVQGTLSIGARRICIISREAAVRVS
jgi:hypothetical protein